MDQTRNMSTLSESDANSIGFASTGRSVGFSGLNARPVATIYPDILDDEWCPKHLNMVDFVERKKTFKTLFWPAQIKQTGEELAEAGFFYKGQSDKVFCFMCGGDLYNWRHLDNVKVEHKHHYPSCKFVRMIGI